MQRFARIPSRPLGFAPWLAALAWISTAGVAFAADRTNPRWAIVASEELRECGVADLLTVQLSDMGIDLVERDAIDKVLKELNLAAAGLADAERSLQFGRLVAADALLLIERGEPAGGSSQRIRLIETRTGIRLLDTLVLEKGLEQEVTAVLQALQGGQLKLTAGTGRRHYVGVLGLHSEEPGAALTGPCRALTTLLEIDLHRLPNVVCTGARAVAAADGRTRPDRRGVTAPRVGLVDRGRLAPHRR
jgi:hypothetical protein